jgi:large repetitive protein
VGGLLTRQTPRGPRRALFGAAIGVAAGAAIFFAVSHSSAAPHGPSNLPSAQSFAIPGSSGTDSTPSGGHAASGHSSGGAAPGQSGSVVSGGHGQSITPGTATSTGSAGSGATPATSGGTLRSHVSGTTPAPFSITADGQSASDTISFGASADLAESGLPGDATGTVALSSDGTALCTITLSVSTDCESNPTTPAGDYPDVQGTYSGDSTYAGSTSTNTIDLTVSPDATTTTVTGPTSSQTYGSPAAFTATISPTDGSGTVSFYVEGAPPTPINGCSALPLVEQGGGTLFRQFASSVTQAIGGRPHDTEDIWDATCTTSSLGAGSYTVEAVYTGDTDYAGSNGVSGPYDVTPATLHIIASSPTINYGDAVPTITPDYIGLKNADTQPSTPPTCSTTATSTSPVSGSPYPSTCTGAADPNYNIIPVPGTVTINPAPTSFSITADGSSTSDTIDFGTTATLAYSGLPGDATGSVVFSSGETTLCTAVLPATSCETDPSLAVGAYPDVTGSFNDTDGNYQDSTSTNTPTLTVQLTPTTTTVDSSANPAIFGDPVTFTASVSPDDGGGTVAFSANGSGITGCDSQSLSLVSGVYQATCTTSSLAVGTYPIEADYSGDSDFGASDGTQATNQSVTHTPTSFTITVGGGSSDTIAAGNTATLAESGLPGAATGSVTFTSGATTLCTLTLPSTSCPTSASLAQGDYTGISGAFTDTDGNFADSTSTNTVELDVNQIATTTSVTASINPSSFGQSVTFTAAVTPNDGGGTVAFFADSSPISGCGAETLSLVSGTEKATCATAGLSLGSHSISATYSGDTDYATSSGNLSGGQTVNKAATSFTITVNGGSSASISFGSTATLGDNSLPGAATGSVTFSSGATTLCTAVLPATTCPTSAALAVGTYSDITGAFADTDGNYNGSTSTNSVSLTVNAVATTTTVNSSANPSAFGTAVTFTASVDATDGGGTVAFSANGSGISGCGTKTLALVASVYEASCTTSTLAVGSHPISAVYSGDAGYAGSSGTLSGGQVVNKDAAPFTITVNSSASASILFGATATLAESSLPGAATGSVTFTSGATTLCSFTLPSTSCTTSATLPVGTYNNVSANFVDTDGDFANSTSTNTVSLTVGLASTTTTLGSSLNPSTYGTAVTFTASVTATDGGGTVAFFADGSVSPISGCGAKTLNSVSGTYEATCTTPSLAAGSHPISATYSGDSSFAGSSGTLASNQVVNQPTLTITASNASIAFGSATPTITASYSGFRNGDTFHSLTTQPTCGTSVTASSPVSGSPYASTCSGAVDANYTIAYMNGTVAVTKGANLVQRRDQRIVHAPERDVRHRRHGVGERSAR